MHGTNVEKKMTILCEHKIIDDLLIGETSLLCVPYVLFGVVKACVL